MHRKITQGKKGKVHFYKKFTEDVQQTFHMILNLTRNLENMY